MRLQLVNTIASGVLVADLIEVWKYSVESREWKDSISQVFCVVCGLEVETRAGGTIVRAVECNQVGKSPPGKIFQCLRQFNARSCSLDLYSVTEDGI